MSRSNENISMQDMLLDILNGRVIPELVGTMAENSFEQRASENLHRHAGFVSRLKSSDVATAVYLLQNGEEQEFLRLVDGLVEDGCSFLEIYLVLLTDCARILGDLWCQDNCSFADVTLGLTFLHGVVRRYRPKLALELPQIEEKGCALVASMPGDTHIFGATMLDVFLASANWQTQLELDEPPSFLQEKAADSTLDLVCHSVSCRDDLDACGKIIRAIRDAGHGHKVNVLVGGKVFMDNPSLVGKIGADAMACDALEALYVCARLFARRRSGYREKAKSLS